MAVVGHPQLVSPVSLVVALDIGGTFTDLVAFDLATGSIRHAKSSTTPYDLSVGIRKTLEKSGLPIDAIDTFVHGSTVAINTAIERNGAKTALLVTSGTRDVYQIGRGNRPESYNFFFKRPTPYVPRRDTFEIAERLNAEGEVMTVLDRAGAERTIEGLKESGIAATAVCFIHSWANPSHEVEVGKLLAKNAPGMFHSLSHEILREYREYERMSTTVLNAYVGPRVSKYLQDLENLLGSFGFDGQLLIMQSNGGSMSPETAKRIPVATMESGPVGGIIAAAESTRALGYKNVIAFDMGGTTAKVSLVQDNEPAIAQGYYVGGEASGHPVMYPVVDIVEVGAGGGSIAWIDEVGALKVGPRSAGGHPGPVCYGQGGTEPTVTDANVVLGRLVADRFLGGEMPLDIKAAREAIRTKLAEPLGLTVEETALGIVRIAIAEMSLAVRSVSVGRGYDPRDFAMVAFGGAGPLHTAEIARELHIPTLIIPRVPGHFSALGMLLADLRHDYVRTYYKPLEACDFTAVEGIFAELIAEGRALLEAEGVDEKDMTFQRFLDMRYIGQEFPIQTPIGAEELARRDIATLRAAFDRTHDRRFGHQAVDEPVEIVNLRLTAKGKRGQSKFPEVAKVSIGGSLGEREIIFNDPAKPVRCQIYDRDRLAAGQVVQGPGAVVEYASTTVLFEGDTLTVASTGELVIRINQANQS
ncbi:MAG TPA: hydantoinase/oxoprolinase family protein [Alphaproteobacteria bacterium]|nr:hydantoinase/oxoprolinase family protein [Alphaproteobacteria bacterium]